MYVVLFLFRLHGKEGRETLEMERSYLLLDDYSHCVCMNETRSEIGKEYEGGDKAI